MGNGGRRTPNPSTQTPKKTHTTLFFSLSPIQRTFERPLHRTLTHPISHPLTLTPTRAHKWSTREEKNKKLFRSPLFRLCFSRYNNSSYFSVFFLHTKHKHKSIFVCLFHFRQRSTADQKVKRVLIVYAFIIILVWNGLNLSVPLRLWKCQ
jgi:hypothetical protein